MVNTSRRRILGITLLDLSKYIIFIGLIALFFHKLDWNSEIALLAVSIITAVCGIYVPPPKWIVG